MNCILQKRIWLAGASLLAIVLGSGDANAVVFGGPGGGEYTPPTTGYYDFTVAGAQGGPVAHVGGFGAIVGGELFLDAGDTLGLIVGGGGVVGEPIAGYAGSGGGGSFVFGGSGLLFAAGGGGGENFGSFGHPGIGTGGHPGGPASYGGGGGAGTAFGLAAPPHPPVPGQTPAQPGSFPNGGAGACCYFGGGPTGGYGGGGGGGYNGGGGGGGAPGGASGSIGGAFGEGGYSYVIDTARNAFGITGGNGFGAYSGPEGANGYVSINFVAAPEASTWAMALTGFAGLGWLARLRRRKLTPG
jgi:hypothetical protein